MLTSFCGRNSSVRFSVQMFVDNDRVSKSLFIPLLFMLTSKPIRLWKVEFLFLFVCIILIIMKQCKHRVFNLQLMHSQHAITVKSWINFYDASSSIFKHDDKSCVDEKKAVGIPTERVRSHIICGMMWNKL